MSTKKIHWTKTPAGRRKISRIQKAHWAKVRAGKVHRNSPQTKQQRKRFAKKNTKHGTITVEGTAFLKKAVEDAAAGIKTRLEAALKEEASPRTLWRTGTGEEILMAEMQEGHLRNAISYCARILQRKLGTAVWLTDVSDLLERFVGLLHEAKNRNLRV